MKIALKVNLQGVNQYYYDDLEDLLSEYESLNSTVDHIVDNSSPSNMKRYLQILLENMKDLQHYRDSTVGLSATDRSDLIIDNEHVLFELKDTKYITQAD